MPNKTKAGKVRELLPRCNAMDSNGIRCRKHSAIEHDYHGDGEIYRNFNENDVAWVRVNFCMNHAIAVGHDFLATSPKNKHEKK